MTLVVNLFAGPGAGKSTTAAKIFADLKTRGIETEIAHEYAKDLTWEDRHKALRFQPYVAAKQIYRVHRLLGEVDVVVTDSPILLSIIYKGQGYTKPFEDYLLDTFKSWNTLNFNLERHIKKSYSSKGRGQSEEEAFQLDRHIKDMLWFFGINHYKMDGPPAPHDHMVDIILASIK